MLEFCGVAARSDKEGEDGRDFPGVTAIGAAIGTEIAEGAAWNFSAGNGSDDSEGKWTRFPWLQALCVTTAGRIRRFGVVVRPPVDETTSIVPFFRPTSKFVDSVDGSAGKFFAPEANWRAGKASSNAVLLAGCTKGGDTQASLPCFPASK